MEPRRREGHEERRRKG